MPSRAAYDVAVVGVGLAGLVAGIAAAQAGARTLVLGRGSGSVGFRSGGVDVLGYVNGRLVTSPAQELEPFRAAHPGHPYAAAGDLLGAALEMVRSVAAVAGLELRGALESNRLTATAAGTFRPGCLVPASMDVPWDGSTVLAVGLGSYRDFSAALFASTLPRSGGRLGVELRVRAVSLDLPEIRRRHLGGMELARLFDDAGFRALLARELKPHLAGVGLVALPAVVGLDRPAEAVRDLEGRLGARVAELPTLPPSIPGVRLERALEAGLRTAGGRSQVGVAARVRVVNQRVERLEVDAAAHPLRLPVGAVVLATGGLLGGGLALGPRGEVVETVADLPVEVPQVDFERWFGRRFLEPDGHRYAEVGVRVDTRLRPLGEEGEPAAANLFAAGGILAGARRSVEKSAEGIACATGLKAGMEAAA